MDQLYLIGNLREDRSVVIDIKHLNLNLSSCLVEGVRRPHCQSVLCLHLVVKGSGQGNDTSITVDNKGNIGATVVWKAVRDGWAQVDIICSHLGDHRTSW